MIAGVLSSHRGVDLIKRPIAVPRQSPGLIHYRRLRWGLMKSTCC